MRNAFVQTVTALMRRDEKVMLLTADMGFSVFEDLQKEFPTRFINTGVTEQSTIGIATGLSFSGFTVFVYAQAAFASMRCFEQVRLDVGYNHANVKVVGVAAGFSLNQLGVSHFALEDVSLMRNIPGMTIFSPGDPLEAEWVTNQAYAINGPCYIRLTKAGSQAVHTKKPEQPLDGQFILCEGNRFTLFVSGNLLPLAKQIVEELNEENIQGTLISVPVIKPFSQDMVINQFKKTNNLFTLEEHNQIGGLGSVVAEIIAESDICPVFHRFGVPDEFIHVTGSTDYLLSKSGLSKEEIKLTIKEKIK